MTGIDALLEILAAAGVRYLFGNPGTTELPLTDALADDPRFRYILGLQEVALTAMADGYAMASGQVGVLCVHISCGLGNAMGMLYNAYREGTPLLLLAGQQDRRLRFEEPVLEADTVRVARPWTRWAAEVHRVEDLPAAVRRAIQTALTPPGGPVFLSLPVDLQSEVAPPLDLAPPCVPDRQVRPPLAALQQAARILAGARLPAILAGSRVTEANGCAALTALAERLGAPVFAEPNTAHGRLPMPADHPLYAGPLPRWSPDIRQRLQDFDVLFVVGMDLLRLYIYQEPARPLPEGVRLIHLDNDPWQIGKNYVTEVGLIGDPAEGMRELDGLLTPHLTAAQTRAATERIGQAAARRQAERQALWKEIDAPQTPRPMTALSLMGALARVLPPNAAVVEEAPTTHQNLLETLGTLQDPTGHFAHRGWALGWGIGCALGVKLAWPERPVLGLIGDGAALYGIQGLWTAAHHQIPVTFLIANNREYRILKQCGDVMGLPQMVRRRYVGLDLVAPEVDFVGLARAFGVEAHRIADPEELMSRVRQSLTDSRPQLFDVPIAG